MMRCAANNPSVAGAVSGLRDRFLAGGKQACAVDELQIENGSWDDYKSLASFHYRRARPGAITAIIRMTHRAPTVVGRYLQRPDQTQVVGVLVRSLPHLSCQLRDQATTNRYRGLSRRDAAAALNREVRTISRVVIDPQWRGLGLAVRLMKQALNHPEGRTFFTEALAAMGRVSPFFERAGMKRYDRSPRPEHARLLDALDHLQIPPAWLACRSLMMERLNRCSDDQRRWLETELRRWHRLAHRTPKSQLSGLSLNDLLIAARDELLVLPVYYLHQHGTCAAAR